MYRIYASGALHTNINNNGESVITDFHTAVFLAADDKVYISEVRFMLTQPPSDERTLSCLFHLALSSRFLNPQFVFQLYCIDHVDGFGKCAVRVCHKEFGSLICTGQTHRRLSSSAS